MYKVNGSFVMGFNGQTAETVLMESDYHRRYFSKFHWYRMTSEFSKNRRKNKNGNKRSKPRR